MNIPALIQCKDIQDDWDGKMAVVDGYNACVYVDPTSDLLKSLKKRQQEDQKKQDLLQELKGKPNTTLDGKTINVFANIGGMGDVGAVQQNDAGGVGLFRTEFVYLNCKDFPTEDYQFEAYMTTALFTIVATWNNYFLPLIMLKDSNWYPLTIEFEAVSGRSFRNVPADFQSLIG